LYSRVTITILVISSLITYDNLNFVFLNKGIGIFGGLFHTTCTTSVFHIFILSISSVILLLTSFYPRKVWLKEYSSLDKILFCKLIYYQTVVINKMGEQYKIIEYSLIILFIVTGALFLISTSDLVSIFLSIELQSYGLYLLSTIYRDSEPATSGGLMYFLLGAGGFRKSPVLCRKPSNSGNLLKLLVPSYSWKVISGWTNYSGTVKSQKMSENEMENRGSNSVILNNIAVKEQRVDGGLHGISIPCIRYTLKGFERNYQVRILSNSINNQRIFYRTISTYQPEPNRERFINPLWLTGFIDGEGCFHTSIYKNNNKIGWAVKIEFEIRLHVKDKVLLEEIQNYFQVGNIFINSRQGVSFRIQSPKDLAKIIDLLDLYPLRTQKLSDYILFKEVFNLILNKQHLTLSGLHKIVAIKASMNLGLSESLQAAFPDVIPRIRPLANNPSIIDPEWLTGFAAAEGCFFVHIFKSPTHKLKEGVQLEFNLTQHNRDELLMKSLIEFFNCGNLQMSKNACMYRVTNIPDIAEKIMPLFEKYPIYGAKSKDFADFYKVLEMVKLKKHLTKEGLEQIRIIKAGMNTGRSEMPT